MAVFAGALFLSAALLFSVQPMAARHALPLLGGTPGVWTAAMLFFQTVLLAGYAYAHLLSARLALRRQIAVHAVVLLLPIALFAVLPAPTPPGEGRPPVLWLLGALAVGVGAPFFALSTTASLLQRWFSRTDHPSAADPYFLYAASNLGSLAGLLAYPLVLEPFLPLARQRPAWAAGYMGFVALAALAALKGWRSPAVAPPVAEPSTVSGRDRLRWILLAAVPSSLLLGVTSHVTTDLAPFPLLWVLPLAFYLMSFVVPFSRRPAIPHGLALAVQPILLIPLAFLIPWEPDAPGLVIPLAVPLHLTAFFATTLVCHGELAERRPDPSGLTDFYLCLAVGGALGGLFNAVVAPLLFRSTLEYPLMLSAAALLRPRKGPDSPLGTALRFPVALLAIGGFTLLTRALQVRGEAADPFRMLIVVGTAVVLVPLLGGRRMRVAGAVAALLACGASGADRGYEVLHRDRSFFGAHRVERTQKGRRHLVHGHILHGAQEEDAKARRLPITYYHREGPCGRMFQAFASRIPGGRVGVLGLGTGTIAAYGLPGQRWTFYEVDPAMERTARRWFTYLDDCPARVDVVLADGRRGIERASRGEFGLIVLDAFSSDAVPVHLLTREALGIYLDRLAEGGWLAVHISNRFVDLQRVVAGHVRERSLAARIANEPDLPSAVEAMGRTRSTWVVLARREEDLRPLDGLPLWTALPSDASAPVWTDDFSAILPLILWR
ncbi:MAG TPA: fused MFS/spermidine synthase [Planctomycetota bacterium]|nr:fused MFS/spermidine synthase [Planctomycetota bacterium]